jgi:Amt family ammonium transporter
MIHMWVSMRVVVWDLIVAGNGALAGLVAITGACAFVPTWAAWIIGFVAGPVSPVEAQRRARPARRATRGAAALLARWTGLGGARSGGGLRAGAGAVRSAPRAGPPVPPCLCFCPLRGRVPPMR